MSASTQAPRQGAASVATMKNLHAAEPDYKAPETSPARRYASQAQQLWGGRLTPIMSAPEVTGRLANGALVCPATACTGSLVLAAGARSQAWRNPQATENIVCLDGPLELKFGPRLDNSLQLGRYDMVSVPANLRVQLVNAGGSAVHLVIALSVPAGQSYEAVFDTSAQAGLSQEACQALEVRFDDDAGTDVPPQTMAARLTRFASLVPYKKDLNRTGGLPPEATESLSAGSVYPLIVPEGHVGRSRTAPIYGNQGLYISIAECKTGSDGPPPHAHLDTQETFFVLEGSFEICTGFDNESVLEVKAHDIITVPSKLMRSFRSIGAGPARLLVIIQGPHRMQDTVAYSRKIGEDFERRFGPEAIAHYEKIRMTFDAEDHAIAQA